MKKDTGHMAVAVLALALGAVPIAAQQQVLTLTEAVSRALAHNPELAIDAPARDAASAQVASSRAGYQPRVDFEQSLAGGNNPVFVFGTLLSQRRFGEANFAIPSLNNPDPVKNLQTRVTAQGTVWDFGRTSQQVSAALLGLELADRSHDEHVKQLLLAVFDSYYSVSLANDAVETAGASLASADSIVKQAQARVDSGLAVEADLLRSQVYLASARQRDIEARGRLEIARAALNRIMGDPLESPFGGTATLSPGPLRLPSEEDLRAQQRQNRPDYQRMLTEVRRAELAARSRKSDFLPILGAYAGWEMDNPSLDTYGGNNWTAGISLRWNLFAGGADRARLGEARSRLEQSNRQLAAMESSMALELHQAFIQVRSAEQQVEVMRTAEAQSRESLRILQNRYEAGLATMTDLLSAETARAEARTNLAEAIYRYRLSYARLESAAGILSPTSTVMTQ